MILLEGWVSQALTSSMLLAMPVALFSGLVSFLSPCILPLLPGYLSYASGIGAQTLTQGGGSKKSLLFGTIGFVFGFSLVFTLTGAFIGGIGSLLLEYQRIITIVVGVLIIVLGLAFMGWLPVPSGWRPQYTPRVGVLASPVLGIVFGLTFTPCIGPALSVVLSLAFNEGSALRGAVLSFVYALGLGLPFVMFALAFTKLAPKLEWLKRHQIGLQRSGGGIMILVGLAMVIGLWDVLMAGIQRWVAAFGTIL